MRDKIRDSVDVFRRTSSNDEIMLVNVENLEYDNFAVFLSALEFKYLRGQIWFYGHRVLSDYPLPIRSRCGVEGQQFDIKSKGVQEFLEAHDAKELEEEFKYLHIYPLRVIWGMLGFREQFITFMYNLEQSSKENFHVLFSQVVEMESLCFVFLFYEWLKMKEQNVIFNFKELEVCKFLRDGKFEKILFAFLGSGLKSTMKVKRAKKVFLETRLFSFLICYKMARVLE